MFAGSTGPKINKDGLTILKASYGIATAMQDVTSDIQNMVQDGELNFTVNAQSIGILDPAPGVKKTLQIQHTINGGHPNLLTKDDGEQVVMSVPQQKVKPDDKTVSGIGMSAVWYYIIALFTVFFTIVAYYAGATMMGYPALGILFAALTLGSYGHFGLLVVPVILFMYYLIYPAGPSIPLQP